MRTSRPQRQHYLRYVILGVPAASRAHLYLSSVNLVIWSWGPLRFVSRWKAGFVLRLIACLLICAAKIYVTATSTICDKDGTIHGTRISLYLWQGFEMRPNSSIFFVQVKLEKRVSLILRLCTWEWLHSQQPTIETAGVMQRQLFPWSSAVWLRWLCDTSVAKVLRAIWWGIVLVKTPSPWTTWWDCHMLWSLPD